MRAAMSLIRYPLKLGFELVNCIYNIATVFWVQTNGSEQNSGRQTGVERRRNYSVSDEHCLSIAAAYIWQL